MNQKSKKSEKITSRAVKPNAVRVLTVITSAAVLLTAAALCSCARGSSDKTIAVITKGQSNAFWQSVRKGAEDAAEKYGYDLTFRGPDSESTEKLTEQKELFKNALSAGPSAVVLGTLGEGFTELLSYADSRGIPVVEFDSGIWDTDRQELENSGENPVVSAVTTDNRDAAELAAEKFFDRIKADIASGDGDFVIGIIQHDETSAGVDRAEGFGEKFNELASEDNNTASRFRIIGEVRSGEGEDSYKSALEALFDKGADAIFMTSEAVVREVYDAISSSGDKYDRVIFCGFDSGSEQIEWIKRRSAPFLLGSVAQDSYKIGYDAVEQAVFAAEKREVTDDIEIDGVWWDYTNVDEMIEKKLVYES